MLGKIHARAGLIPLSQFHLGGNKSMSVPKSVFIIAAVFTVGSMADANHGPRNIPVPAKIADGTEPMPNPYPKPPARLVADGTDPMPRPYPMPPTILGADGGDPMPNPYPKSPARS
jgi:hypothetical protein